MAVEDVRRNRCDRRLAPNPFDELSAKQARKLALHVRDEAQERTCLAHLSSEARLEREGASLLGDLLGFRKIAAVQMDDSPRERRADSIRQARGLRIAG